jgi:hypothetical protein
VPWLKRLVGGLSPRRPGFAPGSIHVGFVVDKVALGRFSPSTSVSPANISFHHLLHIHLSPPHELCDCSDQAAHYHNLGPQLGASLLTRHIVWKQKKKVKKIRKWIWTRSSQFQRRYEHRMWEHYANTERWLDQMCGLQQVASRTVHCVWRSLQILR